MEPYFITCTTCQARLRVRDTSAIGQILTCPKCGSMVLVESPADSNERYEPNERHAGSSSTEATPTVRPPRRPSRPVPSGEPQPEIAGETPAKESSQSPAVSDFADTVEDWTQYGTLAAGSATQDRATRPPDEAPAQRVPQPEFVAEDILPDLDWSVAPDTSRKRWLLGSVAGLAGVILAVALVAWIAGESEEPVARGTGTVTPISAANESAEIKKPAAPLGTPESMTPPKNLDRSAALGPGTGATPQGPLPAGQAPAGQAPAAGKIPDAGPVRPFESAVRPPQPDQPAPAVEVVASPDPAAAIPARSPSPPGFDLNSGATATADRISGSGSLADTLRKLGGIIDTDAAPVEPVVPREPATGAPREIVPAEESPRLPRPAPREVDVAARMLDAIPEIEFVDTPLQDVLQFVTNLSTIPVSLDPDVLMWLNLTPGTPVSLKLHDTNVAGLLDEVLDRRGLTSQTVDQQLFVTYRSPTGEGRRKVTWDVADLIGDDPARLEDLEQHIRALIAPESWNGIDAGGSVSVEGSSLIVEHSSDVLFQVFAFFEKLRVARGIGVRSKFDPRHFQLATRSERAAPLLSKPVTLNYPRPTSFVRVVQRLAKESGLFLLVDWRAAAEAGWNPDATVTFTVANQPVSEALDVLLSPMELTYRIVNETTLQITTPAAVDARLELEFYRLGNELSFAGDGNAAIQRMLGPGSAEWLGQGAGREAIRHDSVSQCLLVALPQPRQQALEKRLAAARKNLPSAAAELEESTISARR